MERWGVDKVKNGTGCIDANASEQTNPENVQRHLVSPIVRRTLDNADEGDLRESYSSQVEPVSPLGNIDGAARPLDISQFQISSPDEAMAAQTRWQRTSPTRRSTGHSRTLSDPGLITPPRPLRNEVAKRSVAESNYTEKIDGEEDSDTQSTTTSKGLFDDIGGTPLTRRRMLGRNSSSIRSSRSNSDNFGSATPTWQSYTPTTFNATQHNTPTHSRQNSVDSFIIRNDGTPQDDAPDMLSSQAEEPETGTVFGIPKALAFYLLIFVLSSISIGYDLGIISPAKLKIRSQFSKSDDSWEIEFMAGLLNIASAVGAIFAGSFADYFGRRPCLLISGGVQAAGSILMGFSPSFVMLCVARVIAGLGIGAGMVAAPLFTAEIAPQQYRGRLLTMTEVGTSTGVVLGYLTGYLLRGVEDESGWRWMLGLGALPALLVLGLVVLVNDSPRWYMEKGDRDKAEELLLEVCSAEECEMTMLAMLRERTAQKKSAWVAILTCPREWRGMLSVGFGVAFLQQACGIEYSVYYTPEVLEAAGVTDEDELLLWTVCLGFIKLLVLIFSVMYVDNRWGRRRMLLASGFGMAISQLALGLSYTLASENLAPILAVVFQGLFMASYSFGFGPVGLVVVSEIFPLQIRGTTMGVAFFINRLANALVASTYFSLRDALDANGAAFVFTVICAISVIFVFVAVPETKDKSLEDIESSMKEMGCCSGGRQRGISPLFKLHIRKDLSQSKRSSDSERRPLL